MKNERKKTRSKKPLSKIPSGALSRGFALAKVSLSLGTQAASHAVGNLFSDEEKKAQGLKKLLKSQASMLADQLGQLKGSLMKAGQMLSMYGEHFLSPEANAVLKSLQSQSPPLAWPQIEKVLKRQLGAEKLALLVIEHESWASASLGQVHLAIRKSDGKRLALKIQYPGVDQAVESDLKTLRSILTMANLLPRGGTFDEIFQEVRAMLHQEVDYQKELQATRDFREIFADDARVVIPQVFEEFSSGRVLATSFEEGFAVDGPEVAALFQDRRNRLAELALDVYFRELFEVGRVQTDPHFGNYRVRIARGGFDDQLVLLDFGAVRKFPKSFLAPYRNLVRGAYQRDRVLLKKAALELGFLVEGDSQTLQDRYFEVCELITEPFACEEYDWGNSDLPRRVGAKAKEILLAFRLRVPPREIIFLDRKMSGLFIFLAVLKARIRSRDILEKYL